MHIAAAILGLTSIWSMQAIAVPVFSVESTTTTAQVGQEFSVEVVISNLAPGEIPFAGLAQAFGFDVVIDDSELDFERVELPSLGILEADGPNTLPSPGDVSPLRIVRFFSLDVASPPLGDTFAIAELFFTPTASAAGQSVTIAPIIPVGTGLVLLNGNALSPTIQSLVLPVATTVPEPMTLALFLLSLVPFLAPGVKKAFAGLNPESG